MKIIKVWTHPQFDMHWFSPSGGSPKSNSITDARPFDYWIESSLVIGDDISHKLANLETANQLYRDGIEKLKAENAQLRKDLDVTTRSIKLMIEDSDEYDAAEEIRQRHKLDEVENG